MARLDGVKIYYDTEERPVAFAFPCKTCGRWTDAVHAKGCTRKQALADTLEAIYISLAQIH